VVRECPDCIDSYFKLAEKYQYRMRELELQARDLWKKLALVVIGVGGAVTMKERDVDLFEPDTVVLEEFHFGPDYVIRIADR
jgi:hypothetical protein